MLMDVMYPGLFAFCVLVIGLPSVDPWTLDVRKHSCNNSSLYELIARAESQSVHGLIAADDNIRPPAMILVHTHASDSITYVDCEKYSNASQMRDSVKVMKNDSSYGMLFYQACLYVDGDDRAEIIDPSKCHTYFGSNLNWSAEVVTNHISTSPHVTVHLRGVGVDNNDRFLDGGSVLLNFTMYAVDSESPFGSHYHVTSGLHIQIDLALDRLNVLDKWSRFAPNIMIFSNQSLELEDDFLQKTVEVDSPLGTVHYTNLFLNERRKGDQTRDNAVPGFALLPPLAYVIDPSTANTKDALRRATPGMRIPVAHKGTAKHFSHSLCYAFYGDRFNQPRQPPFSNQVGVREQLINLGNSGDGFYSRTNYIAWTMVLGFGTPDIEPTTRSSTIITTLAVVCVVVLSVLGVCCWRCRRTSYQRLESQPTFVAADLGGESPTHVDRQSRLVEPVQARKLLHLFTRRTDHSTLTVHDSVSHAPPAYDSLPQE